MQGELALLAKGPHELLDVERIALGAHGGDATKSRAGRVGVHLRIYEGENRRV